MADIRLQPIQRQNNPTLVCQALLQGPALHQPRGQQLIIAVEQISDAALGNGDTPSGERRMNLRHAAMLAIPQSTDQRDDVEAELMLGQRQCALCLGSVGFMKTGTIERLTAADLETQPDGASEGHKCAPVLVADPHQGSASRTKPTGWTQHPLAIWQLAS